MGKRFFVCTIICGSICVIFLSLSLSSLFYFNGCLSWRRHLFFFLPKNFFVSKGTALERKKEGKATTTQRIHARGMLFFFLFLFFFFFLFLHGSAYNFFYISILT
ncbi:hypothetical protein ACQKWADRAFT_297505, partial [Trichoderma austrokoningii]